VLAAAENLEVLNLSCNQLTSLQVLSHCSNLRELFLRKNQVTDLAQLQPLQQLKNLTVLWLSGNPVEQETDYRATVIQMFPQLVSLDDSIVTEEERREVQNSTAADQQKGHVMSAVLCLLPVLSQQELKAVHDAVGQLLSQQCQLPCQWSKDNK
jgi:hypothetical protein